MFPAPPPWEGLHVLVVHMPIGMLLTASLFVLLATVFPRWAGTTALILLVLGTAGAWVAVATGEAARDVVEDGPDPMWEVLERHEELAELTLNAFAGVTVLYAVILLVPLFWKKAARPAVTVIANLAVLVLLLGANLLLANAAHLGGHLVHLYGVRAQLGLDEPLSEVEDESAEDASAEEPLEDSTAESSDAAMSESPAGAAAEEPASSADATEQPAAATASPESPAVPAPAADGATAP